VQFTENDGTPIGSAVPLDATGHATLTVTGDAGSYLVHARYPGDNYFAGSDGSTVQRIDRADTATSITSDPNPVDAGGLLTITVIIDVLPPGDVLPDGPLQFLVDDQPFGGPVDISAYSGLQVTLRAPSAPSTNTIAVRYLGGPNTNPSSASLRQTVSAASSTTSPTSTIPNPSATRPAPVPTTAAGGASPTATQAISTMTAALRKALQRRGVRGLDGAIETFHSPSAGRLDQQVYLSTAPATALPAAAKGTVVASGSRRFAAAQTASLKLKLTAAGRRTLRRTGTVNLQVVTRFTPASGRATRRVDRIKVPAKAHSPRAAAIRSATLARRMATLLSGANGR
jgi:hypothetical protein